MELECPVLEPAGGFEPPTSPLPRVRSGRLSYTGPPQTRILPPQTQDNNLVEGEGFEPPKASSRRVYSPVRLTASLPLQNLGNFTASIREAKARGPTRTGNPPLTRRTLYRLSYTGFAFPR